jgi:N-acetylneuraminic acid mutarotase
MRTTVLSAVVMSALLSAGACGDGARRPLGPTSTPRAAISDATRGGNDHFYFLPPMVARPTFGGTFDASQSPVVEICEWDGTACAGPPLATYTRTSGPGEETVRVPPDEPFYIVNWHSERFDVEVGKVYRVRVSVAGTELGFADVTIYGTTDELREIDRELYVPLRIGRSLPVRFRIEQGAVYVLGPDGGTISAVDGAVRLVVPPGALEEPVGIVVLPMRADDIPPGLGIIPGSMFDFQPSGLTFAVPATLTLAYDEARIPTGVPEAALTLLDEYAGVWDELHATSVDATANTVTGAIAGFSRKAVATAATVITVAPPTAALSIGETVQLSATVTNAGGQPIGRPTSWTTGDAAVATVDATGLVSAVGPGSATITVSAGQVTADAQITSTAVVAVSPATASVEAGDGVQLAATVTDFLGNPLPLAVQWSSSSASVATVSATGLVSGVAAGNATITAQAGGGQAQATVQVTAASLGSWSFVAPMPTARGRMGAAVANGLLYTVGGSWYGNGQNLEVYDPATNGWTVKAPMPTAREAVAAGAVNGIVYAVGGGSTIYSVPTHAFEAYDPAANSWSTKAPIPTGRLYPGVAELDGLLYVVGGGVAGVGAVATVEVYDPATNSWSSRASMPTARSGPAVAVVNGILYAIGGYTGSAYVGTVEAYDPATNGWTTKAPMPTLRSNSAAGVVSGKIFVAGGTGPPSATCNIAGVCKTVQSYNPLTDVWTARTSLTTQRYTPAGGVIGNVFYVAGGLTSPGSGTYALGTVEKFQP